MEQSDDKIWLAIKINKTHIMSIAYEEEEIYLSRHKRLNVTQKGDNEWKMEIYKRKYWTVLAK